MKKIIYLSFVAFCSILFACQSEEKELNKVGYLNLCVTQDVAVVTKTAPVEGYNPEKIGVTIWNSKGVEVELPNSVKEWVKGEKQVITLPVGTYTIQAASIGYDGSEELADTPYYASERKSITIGNQETAVTLTCTLANVKFSVRYDDNLKDVFKDIVTTVNSITFHPNDTKSAYFPVGDLKLKTVVTNKAGITRPLKDTTFTEVKARNHYIINYKLGGIGSSNIKVTVDPTTKETVYNFLIGSDVSAEKTATLSANAWSTFANITAENVSGATGAVKFQYRQKNVSEWKDVEASKVGEKYQAKITGLTSNTTYEYQLVDTETVGQVEEFTTEEATVLVNGNFNEWNMNKKAWFAGTAEEASSQYSFWDSGNVGAATLSKNPTEPVEGENAYSGKSASLKSQYVGVSIFGKFAAGNIYTGHYCDTYTSGGYGARIRFGQPFTSRPTALKGVYKYTRGTKIDYGTDPYKTELQNSGGDRCAIYIVLTDNEGLVEKDGIHKYAFEIDNHAEDQPDKFIYKSTIDFSKNNPHVIAYGTLSEEESKGAATYTPFTIKLKYRDLTRKPKYIIVVASASMYGDFFTGSTDSQMYIDNFELDYEGEPVIE